ncbi:MAG TPA: hypothetical protein VHR16_08000 [Candidatus Limnocylindrales bacterium]|jgi:hypothetical protein|nr:hypothetical protein [Candidatus Limnocylindrales bacterium]
MVALAVALVLAVQPIWRDSVAIGVAGLIALTLLAAARWQLRWLPVVVLVICGAQLRIAAFGAPASDVSDVTSAAIQVLMSGGDPYGLGYLVSRPAGAAFPYGPVALLWYLPMWWDPRMIEIAVSGVLLGWLGLRAARGRPLGLAIFAVAPPLVLASVDGSNDTTAGLMILAAMALAVRRPALGSIVLAVAVAFKPYAIAWVPALLVWAGWPAVLAFVGASIVAWGPILFLWGPSSYLKSLAMAQETHLRSSYWSLGAVLDGIAPGLAPRALETIRYVISGAVAVLGALRVNSLDGVIVVGSVAFVLAQFTGYFGSYVYIAAVAPLLCWRVDDWLRMGLPELSRAYGAVPEIGRRLGRPAPARPTTVVRSPHVPAHPFPHAQPQVQPHAPARLLQGVQSGRARTGRPSRTSG